MSFCQNCGSEFGSSDAFCTKCGAKINKIGVNDIANSIKATAANIGAAAKEHKISASQSEAAPTSPVEVNQNYQPVYTYPAPTNVVPVNNAPNEASTKLLGAWSYFGYSLLFSIPILGIIINLACCFSAINLNLKHYARSFWCWYIIIAVAAIIIVASGASILSFI